MNDRKIALKLLLDAEENGKYVNLTLNSKSVADLPAKDKAFITALLYTTVERKITLDYLIGAFLGKSPDSLSDHTRNLLRIGLCQVLFLDRVPDFAAVGETVDLAQNPGERGLVNGILRRAAREKEILPYPPRAKNTARYLSVVYSFPLPVVKHFMAMIGEAQTETLLATFNRPAPLSLTVNTLKTDRDTLLRLFAEHGFEAAPSAVTTRGILLSSSTPVASLPGYKEGLFFIQDEASRLQGDVLGALPGERIIDVCAAPGGKSFYAAVSMQNQGEILSFDIHESKLSLISDGAARLGISVLKADVKDAEHPDPALFGRADRVICDVPCSGLGVLGKKPDLRYKNPEAWGRLPALGLSILKKSAAYVKDGGILLYSTCTLSDAENREVVDAFLSEHSEFSLTPFSVDGKNGTDGTLTLFPHRDGTDGFYIAKLTKGSAHD